MSVLQVRAAGLTFENPGLLAAGTAAYGRELADVMSLETLGGFVTKAVSLEPRAGAPAPRVTDFDGGMLNAVGLANPGVDAVLRDESEGVFSVCRSPDPALAPEVRIETVCGVAMDLVERIMWIAPDVPARVAFEPVALSATPRQAAKGTQTKIAAD